MKRLSQELPKAFTRIAEAKWEKVPHSSAPGLGGSQDLR